MSDELTRRLRELAEEAEAPPRLPGAGIRAAAGRRRHRRRTTAFLAGGCVAATLAAVLTVHVTGEGTGHGAEQRSSPLAPPGPDRSADRDVPYVTVDLSRQVLAAEGRELPVSLGTTGTPTPTGLMTVTGKETVRLVSGGREASDATRSVRLRWVLELAPLDRTDLAPGEKPKPGTGAYIASALTDEEVAPRDRDTTAGWITLRPTDAAWLYEQLPEGAVVEIVARSTPATPAAPTTPKATPKTAQVTPTTTP
ncbi:L,D-transpeptidase family protein [Streptomyces neyagawaensis]|uniref:L,D-transpeptidase family protein n=1 Tax=Streptomyces neyagawaensis TaxID=42238 RepID=UPI0006E1363E|nr:L,D-transpeptidase family protein [Streptomyces neyagawaensis]MCL6734653.1 L,D-transpeptidase family protein [Streptomyces neyagawaensis]MDE1682184.1 L,D-transpeptidase family protein [Streptomyces neyagawaensis]